MTQMKPLRLHYTIACPAEKGAGIVGYTEDVTVIVESGEPVGDTGEFIEACRQFLAGWFEGSTVALFDIDM